jgi:hypothetical protein
MALRKITQFTCGVNLMLEDFKEVAILVLALG